MTTAQTKPTADPVELADIYARKVLEIVRVVDGDSVVARLDLGYHIHATVRIRLKDIDAPETNRGRLKQQGMTDPDEIERTVAAGKASRDFLEVMLSGALAQETLVVVTYKYRTEKYGRYLGEFFTAGTSINALMVSEGQAVPYETV